MARILLIEDEPAIAEIMEALLRHGEFEVLSARDGVEGLEMARREEPDLILLDIRLPRMDGIEVNAELLKSPRTRDIPVMVVTTQSIRENRLSEAPNVRHYIQKTLRYLKCSRQNQRAAEELAPKSKRVGSFSQMWWK